jgi:hypothetical protein
MTERPPTRYDEEGKSLPERGSGRAALEAALAKQAEEAALSSQLDTLRLPGEPEKLTLPAEAVVVLLNAAIQHPLGNAWWNGFVTAHGVPSWIAEGKWRFVAQKVEVVWAPDAGNEHPNGVMR